MNVLSLFDSSQSAGIVSGTRGDAKTAGGKPSELLGKETQMLEKLAQFPANFSPATLQRAAQQAGRLKATAIIASRISGHMVDSARSLQSVLKVRVSHANSMMKVQRDVQGMLAQHNSNVALHGVLTGEVHAKQDAFQDALSANSGMF